MANEDASVVEQTLGTYPEKELCTVGPSIAHRSTPIIYKHEPQTELHSAAGGRMTCFAAPDHDCSARMCSRGQSSKCHVSIRGNCAGAGTAGG